MINEFIKGFRKGISIAKSAKKKNYYEHIDEVPVYNFFKIANGKYQYLYKDKKDYDSDYPKELFRIVFTNMYFQFRKLDNTYLRDKAKLEIYWSRWISGGEYRWKNEFNTLANKIETEVKKELNLDDFTDFIERTFNNSVGSLDVYKVSTSKAFNNYHRAVEINKTRDANNKTK